MRQITAKRRLEGSCYDFQSPPTLCAEEDSFRPLRKAQGLAIETLISTDLCRDVVGHKG